MPLGIDVGLGTGDIVLDGDLAPPLEKMGAMQPPLFGRRLLWTNGWMDQDATWYEGRPGPRRCCVIWEPSSPPKKKTKGDTEAPTFRPMSVLAKRLDGLRCHLVRM